MYRFNIHLSFSISSSSNMSQLMSKCWEISVVYLFFLHTHFSHASSAHTNSYPHSHTSVLTYNLSLSLLSEDKDRWEWIMSYNFFRCQWHWWQSWHLISMVTAAGLWSELRIKWDKSILCFELSHPDFSGDIYLKDTSSLHANCIFICRACREISPAWPQNSVMCPLLPKASGVWKCCDSSNRSITQCRWQQMRWDTQHSPSQHK